MLKRLRGEKRSAEAIWGRFTSPRSRREKSKKRPTLSRTMARVRWWWRG